MNVVVKNLYALAIIAHPDDESFLLAGTSLKLAEEGKSVGVICVTRGEKGADRLNRNLNEEQMAGVRVKELLQACNILRCKCTECFDHPDGGLDKIKLEDLVEEIRQKIDQYKPEIILTFGEEGVSGHRDHIITGKAALAAVRQATHKIKEAWLMSMPASQIDKFNEHQRTRRVHLQHFETQILKGVPDEKLAMIDITPFAKQKHEAIKAHQSQYLPDFVIDIFLKQECFEVIKMALPAGRQVD